jgi:antibiotic biosynthesis monooxygenase (ABM) superfamily enzyme
MSNEPMKRPHPPAPSKHQLAVMIWVAVVPTLTALNLTLGARLDGASVVTRTFVIATVAVPIVSYGLMPYLHRLRAWLLARTYRSVPNPPTA